MAVTGLRSSTSPAHLLRACLEALAYQLGAVYDQLNTPLEQQEIVPMLIGSGGAMLSSPVLQAIIAATLNTPIYPLLEREASARGPPLLALQPFAILPASTLFPLHPPPLLPPAHSPSLTTHH